MKDGSNIYSSDSEDTLVSYMPSQKTLNKIDSN
jgi:hypothetical protein